jgi:magnesium-transporting ATPase (P-type)
MAINSGSTHTVTPIQRKLTKLGQYLIVLAIGLCALVVGIGLAWHKDMRTTINIGLRYIDFAGYFKYVMLTFHIIAWQSLSSLKV